MSITLTELFVAAKGGPIKFQGKIVEMSHRLQISKGQEVEIEFLKITEKVTQGIEVSVDQHRGHIEINGESLKAPIFWTETAPRVFHFKCQTPKDCGTMNVWNVWKNTVYMHNVDSWIGNSGMYVESSNDHSWVFYCSNGIGGPNFEDLVFKLTLC